MPAAVGGQVTATSDSRVNYAPGFDVAAFNAFLQQSGLIGYAGKIVPRNSFTNPDVTKFDLRISQELPGFFKGHKSEIALDIMNVGNLLNKDWGLIEDYGFYSTRRVANYAGIDPVTGKYVYHFTRADNEAVQENNQDKGNTAVSRWSMMLSFKYKF